MTIFPACKGRIWKQENEQYHSEFNNKIKEHSKLQLKELSEFFNPKFKTCCSKWKRYKKKIQSTLCLKEIILLPKLHIPWYLEPTREEWRCWGKKWPKLRRIVHRPRWWNHTVDILDEKKLVWIPTSSHWLT